MFVHHFFFSYLNEKSVDPDAAELPSIFRDQNTVAFIGTTIAHGARAVLSMAVGITFAQLFWETLRSRSFTVRQIDALVRCGQSPFNPSALRAATASFLVFLISCIASAMALVVIITPGSLTISSDSRRSKLCTVPTVPDLMGLVYPWSDSLLQSTENILASGTYLPPFRAVTCDSGSSSCSYNVSFIGPAFDCIDVSNQTNFTDFLHAQDNGPFPSLIWSGKAFDDFGGKIVYGLPVGVSVLTQDLVTGVTQANNCTAYNATYEVSVTLQGESTSVQVRDVMLHSVMMNNDQINVFISAYAEDAVGRLIGFVYTGPTGFAPTTGTALQNAAFFVTTPAGNHTWSDSIPHILTTYMQNVSLSLLSGTINTGFSNATATNFLYVNSTCISTITVYVYDSVRLLSTYGFALVIVLLTVVPGCFLIQRNGAEEKLLLSHILQFALNEKLCRVSGEVQEEMLVRLTHGSPGKLLPKSNNSLMDDVPFAAEKFGESMQEMLYFVVFLTVLCCE